MEFIFSETNAISGAAVRDVLTGKVAGTVARGAISAECCENLYERFVSHPQRRLRAGDATGSYLGTFHWGKSMDDFRADCSAVRPAVEALIGSPEGEPWRIFVELLRNELSRADERLRLARWGDVEAVVPLIREWERAGAFSLVPHEDLSQCEDPKQRGYEIQAVPRAEVCSVNLCLANDAGGELVLWDIRPTAEERRRLGTQIEGGPYPVEWLNGRDQLTIAIEPGDLYVFNGSYVHAVGAAAGRRATVSSLLGFATPTDVVLWT